jgi:methylenetetrahydrofolate reductase (NADPH)
MPIQSYQMIKRTTKLSHVKIPPRQMALLDAVKGDDEKVKMVGVDIVSELVVQVRDVKRRTPGPRGFHFYTLNLEKAVSFIVERTNLIPPSTPDEEFLVLGEILTNIPTIRVNDSGSTTEQSVKHIPRRQSSIGSDPRDRVIISGLALSHPEYEATALDASVPAEPINTRANTLAISEGEGALGREATWDDYPNGRWGDARSPAYGEIDGYGVSLHVSVTQALDLWGTPRTKEDINAVFIRHLKGELGAIPWSEEGFSAETATIKGPLLELNSKGWWTLASQPAVNGIRSTDPTFGWGPSNGFVFQKAFVEFFLPAADWKVLFEKLSRPEMKDAICFYATNADGDSTSSDVNSDGGAVAAAGLPLVREPSTNAVTWGVFPGKEIVTPTIIEEVSFRAWSEEAFGIWAEWAKVYGKGSETQILLEQLRADVWLVNVIHNDYVDKDALWDLLLKE